MIASTALNLLEPSTWRRLWARLGELEKALATTEGDIHERRISRLEAEIAELRAHAGLPVAVRGQSPDRSDRPIARTLEA